jgi:hypothetical protein
MMFICCKGMLVFLENIDKKSFRELFFNTLKKLASSFYLSFKIDDKCSLLDSVFVVIIEILVRSLGWTTITKKI